MEKLVGPEEFDLGIVDVTVFKMELAELGLTPSPHTPARDPGPDGSEALGVPRGAR